MLNAMLPISIWHLKSMREAPPRRLFLLLTLYIYFAYNLNAQVQAGQFHLAGQFSFENDAQRGVNYFSSIIRPEIGLMLSPKWSAGLSLPFNIQASSSSRPYYRMGAGVFVRRYFDLKSGFYAIVHLQTETNLNFSSRETRGSFWSIQATPSISYFFSPRFAFEAGFGGFTYSSSHTRSSIQDHKNYSTQLRIQSTPVFSLRYYFPHSSSGKITH